MKTLTILVLVLGLGVVCASLALPRTAECGFGCPDTKCYNNFVCFGDSCVCIKKGSATSGSCYSIERAEDLVTLDGWSYFE